jgi:hypothetical protein
MDRTDWAWWAGRDEEWMQVGPCATREDAIHEGLDYFDDDFVVLEAKKAEIGLSATIMLDHAYECWADDDCLFSSEFDPPEPRGSVEDQRAAEAELQALLDNWVDKWRHTLPTPNMFAATRNLETVALTPSTEEKRG